MARADVFTLLPLDEYAKIMGINPLHFNGGRVPDVAEEPYIVSRDGAGAIGRPIWHQFSWQDPNQVSHNYLARSIQQAEQDVADFLRYWPAPVWRYQEVSRFPRPYRPEFYGVGRDVRWQMKPFKTQYGKVISGGRRTVALIATATVAGGTLVYSDPDSLGFDALATITVPTVLTDVCEIKVYYTNQSGAQEFEIRPVKSKSISGGFVTITVDSWLLFSLAERNLVPQQEITVIDAGDSASYAISVEVYREFNDFSEPSAQFFWKREPQLNNVAFSCLSCGGTGCVACSLISQDGCLQASDPQNGMVAGMPATYDEDTDLWTRVCWTECREPDIVKIWYKSGLISQKALAGGCTELDDSMARTIAVLATARIPLRFRADSNLQSFIDFWQRDQSESTADGSTIFTPQDVLSNPFGTRRGEVEAYKRLSKIVKRIPSVAAVLA